MEKVSATIVDDFKLIELVRQNSYLYDKNNHEYRDVLKKTLTWKAIGLTLGASGEVCRKRFRCLRDRFNKERKVRKNEMLEDPSLPAVYKKMLFLWDHLTHRRESFPTPTRHPTDGAQNAEEVREEIEKQIRILSGDQESSDGEENATNENSACELKNEILLIFDETGKIPEGNNTSEQRQGVVCTYLVPGNTIGENSACEQPPQIIFLPSEAQNSSKKNIACEQSNTNDRSYAKKKEILETSSMCEQPKQTDKSYDKNKDISEKKGASSQRKDIVPVSDIAKKIRDKSACEQPNKRMKIADSIVQPTKDIDAQIHKVRPTVKPCNEAFCAIVKQYLDKITSPERLSSARLQILTILHNELYSTYS